MAGHTNGELRLCWLGRTAQKLGCLPKIAARNTPVYYPLAIHAVDSVSGYGDDIKYQPGPRLPPPQPEEPKSQMMSQVVTYQLKPPRVPKTPKKTPVAQTVPLSTLPLPVNTLPVCTPAATCLSINIDLPPVRPTIPTNHTPYLPPLSAIPHTPGRNAVPDSVLQDLAALAPTQFVWNTPHGALTYTPSPASHFPLPNPLSDPAPCSPRVVDAGDANNRSLGLGIFPSPDSSDASSACSDSDHRLEVRLNPLFMSDCLLTNETPIEWNVSQPVDLVKHVRGSGYFCANAAEPATNPPTNTLRIDLFFVDQPRAEWNWEPIITKKARPVRIVDVFHAIHDYFQLQLTYAEYDVVKSHGKANARIVANSWRERVAQSETEAQSSQVFHGGLRRVDCLGSSKIFAGLSVEGSKLVLSLRA